MIEGLVSTIIPVHNRSALLREAVDSVLQQTYPHVEVIIINDGSTDNTREVADHLARKSEIKVLHRENRGPGAAREAGRQVAAGEFIQYLDSDDILLPDKFSMQVEGLRKNRECGVSYGMTSFLDSRSGEKSRPWKRTGEDIRTMFPAFLESRWWGTSTPFYRRELVDKVGSWTDLRNEEDWEYDCRIAARGVSLHRCTQYVSEQRDRGDNRLSSDGATDPAKLRDRAQARELIYRHALKAGISHNATEMRLFARWAFLLARQCGVVGLSDESRRLVDLARRASGAEHGAGRDIRAYWLGAGVIGWRTMAQLSVTLDRLRKKIAVGTARQP